MAAGVNARWQRRPLDIRQRVGRDARILAVIRRLFTAEPPMFATSTGCIPTHCHSRAAAFARSKQRDLRSKRVLESVLIRSEIRQDARHPLARHLGETAARRADV